MIGDRANVQRAVNQLIAAAIAWRDRSEEGKATERPEGFAEWKRRTDEAGGRLIDAIAGYEQTRSEGDAARDEFLAKYPRPSDLQDAVSALIADGARHHGIHSQIAPDVDAALDAAEKIPGAWVGPEGNLHCHRHIDGCPPGTDYNRAWHRMTVTGLGGPDDPEPGCGKHTGVASNRCLLAADHQGPHDDLGGAPQSAGQNRSNATAR